MEENEVREVGRDQIQVLCEWDAAAAAAAGDDNNDADGEDDHDDAGEDDRDAAGEDDRDAAGEDDHDTAGEDDRDAPGEDDHDADGEDDRDDQLMLMLRTIMGKPFEHFKRRSEMMWLKFRKTSYSVESKLPRQRGMGQEGKEGNQVRCCCANAE